MDLDLSGLGSATLTAPRGPYTILMVCTGNICRSAFAAALLEKRLAGAVPTGAVVVDSAGTDVNTAIEMPPLIRQAVIDAGADPDTHVITALRPEDIESADLVITMTGRQRGEVARRAPRAASYTVTLAELVRLIHSAPAEDKAEGVTPVGGPEAALGVRESMGTVLGRRGFSPRAKDEDVSDPWQRSDEVYHEAIGRIRELIAVVADRIVAGARGGSR